MMRLALSPLPLPPPPRCEPALVALLLYLAFDGRRARPPPQSPLAAFLPPSAEASAPDLSAICIRRATAASEHCSRIPSADTPVENPALHSIDPRRSSSGIAARTRLKGKPTILQMLIRGPVDMRWGGQERRAKAEESAAEERLRRQRGGGRWRRIGANVGKGAKRR